MENVINVVIGCGADPDSGYSVRDVPTGSLGWRGMLEGIPLAGNRLQKLTDSDGIPPTFTRLLRADHQIRQVHGVYNHVLNTYRDFPLRMLSRLVLAGKMRHLRQIGYALAKPVYMSTTALTGMHWNETMGPP